MNARPAAVCGTGLVLAFTAACKDATRPTFPGADLDTLPPSIQIVSPPPDTTVTRPAVLVVQVLVEDESHLSDITASVSGVLAFGFPSFAPPSDSTRFAIQFPIPTENAPPGDAMIVIEATDRLRNHGTRSLSFVVK